MISLAEVVAPRALERSQKIDPGAAEDFLAIACHELRNPLALMLLHAEVSLRRLEEGGDEKEVGDQVKHSVRRLQDTARHLARTCETLLDTRALESGKRSLRRELLDVATLVRTLAERYRPMCERANCEVSVFAEGVTTAFLDPARLEQIVVNLLVNAAKHAPDGRIELGVHGDGNDLFLEVTDHGEGISPEEQRHLGEFFSRLAGTRGPDSVGLGLWIAASLAEQMGGQLRCVSTIGRGTTFVVRLPRRAERFEEDSPQLHLPL